MRETGCRRISVTIESESGSYKKRFWLRDGPDGDAFVSGIPGMLSSLVLDPAEATTYEDDDEACSRFWTWFAVLSRGADGVCGRVRTVKFVYSDGSAKIVRKGKKFLDRCRKLR